MAEDRQNFFYGWVVVAACFVAATSYGLFYTFGVFFKSLQAEFGWGRALTGSVHSVHLVIYALSTYSFGRFTDTLGPRRALTIGAVFIGIGLVLCSRINSIWQLYLFYGIASLGSGVTVSLPNATVQRWFIEKRGLALGMVTAGVGAGTFLLAPLSEFLIASFGWRTAYVVIGIFYGTLLAAAATAMVRSPEEKELKPYGWNHAGGPQRTLMLKDWPAERAIRTGTFWLIIFIYLFTNLPVHMVMVHVVPYFTDMGISKSLAAGALGLIGGISISGRIGMGVLGERMGWKWGLLLCCAVCAVMTFWLIGVRSMWMLMVFAVGYGFFYGGKITNIPGLIGFTFGTRALGEIIGIIHAVSLAGGIVGPVLGGYVFDVTGSYRAAFIIGALGFVTSAILTFLVRPPKAGAN
ncbi:MAG TPA: MFS transporter, partial [Thermodesulfobacteriota bacterium]|nr:MFS transporter [Thermodesulfobacteriota bacterium]